METKVKVLLIATSPLILLGIIAWTIYAAFIAGWNIADAYYEKEKENE